MGGRVGVNLIACAPTDTIFCPFCGSDGIYIISSDKYYPEFEVYCDDCGEYVGYLSLEDYIDWKSVGEFVKDCGVV